MAISLPLQSPRYDAASASTMEPPSLPGVAEEVSPAGLQVAAPGGEAVEVEPPREAPAMESPPEQDGGAVPAATGLTEEAVGQTIPQPVSPTGIPQSHAAPAGMMEHLDAEEMRRRAAEEREKLEWARWRAEGQARVFGVVLGDAKAREGVDVFFHEDAEHAWRTVGVDGYLMTFLNGEPLPKEPMSRDLLRYKVAQVMFNGRGADSDEAFHAELVKAAGSYQKSLEQAGDMAQQFQRAAKVRRLYGSGAGGKGDMDLTGLESHARDAHAFTPRSFTGKVADFIGWDERGPEERKAMYEAARDGMAESYGLTTGELEDVLRHRMDAQEKEVSRDALGMVHIKNELMIRGEEEIGNAIRRSDLTPEEKEQQMADLPARFSRFKEGVVANVIQQMPEFAKEFGIRSVADFDKLAGALHEGWASQAAGGIHAGLGRTAASLEYVGGLFEEKVRLGGLLGDSYLKERSKEMDRRVMVNEQINALSHEFNKAKTTLFGVDAAAIGQGVYSVVESAALAALTGPLAPEVSVVRYGRVAMMFNSAAKVAPVAAFMGGRQASATYDEAIRRNFSTDQAEELAMKAGAIEFLTTVVFSGAGAGGVEGIASGASRQALREGLQGTARNALREALKAGGKGMLGELAEEELITILDTALVQTKLEPGMTAEDFQRAVYETAVVTFIGSGGFSVMHGKHAYDDTLANNMRIGGEMAAGTDGGLTTMDGVDAAGAAEAISPAPPQLPSPPNPPDNPFRTPEGNLPIQRQVDPAVDPDLAARESEFIEALSRPIEEVDADYNAIHDEFESSYGGKVISTDLPRKMLKPFAESKEGRERYTGITTAGARAYGRDRLWREIHNRGERRKLMFTAGGIAAGKSSVVNEEVIAAQDLVYDATLRETDWAIRNIEKALEKGWDVQIVYVQRPIELALQGAIHRAGQQGRSFPLADLPAAHRDAQRSIIEIAKRFEGNEKFRIGFWFNAGTQGEKATKLSLPEIDKGGKYSYEHISHVTDTGRTKNLARSHRRSGDESVPEHRQESGRKALLDAFRQAVGRKDLSREILSGLAGKDAELQRILSESGSRDSSQTTEDSAGSPPVDGPPDGDAPGDDTLVHERSSKSRKKEPDPDRKDWAEAKAILEKVLNLSSSRMNNEQYEKQPRRKMLFGDKLETTPEERMILKSKYEIVLVYSKEGRLLTSVIGSRRESRIPLLDDGEISSHNHPGGRGPSALDIRFALDNPRTIMRIVTKNESGGTEIFQIRAKGSPTKKQIDQLVLIYDKSCKAGGDNRVARRNAIILLTKFASDTIEIESSTQ